MSHTIETLQIAQIIADLQTLANADHTSALSLLTPQLALHTTSSSTLPSRRNSAQKPRKSISALTRTISTTTKPPVFTREGSSTSTGSLQVRGSSGVNTPVGSAGFGSAFELDEDLKRAKTLLELFEMRGKFKQMGDTGLVRAKERVDEVVARYARVELEEREKVARARHLGVSGAGR